VVFPDRTLEAIACARPTSREQLSFVSGVGPAKLSSYGAAVLRVLARFSGEHPPAAKEMPRHTPSQPKPPRAAQSDPSDPW